MSEHKTHLRRKYFINRKFQTEFSLRFVLIIAAASISLLFFFLYNSRGTMTAGYNGSEVQLLQTGSYFLPSLIVSTIVIVLFSSLTGVFAMVFLSHRIVGPLFRFQASLRELHSGDLTRRFNLRDRDQFKDLADQINTLSNVMDEKIGEIKKRAAELSVIIENMQSASVSQACLQESLSDPLQAMTEKVMALKEAADYFQTTPRK
jgi:methyl-accepting chemotaxis protein